jgi:hypothetical protein
MEYCFTQDGIRGGENMLIECRPGVLGAADGGIQCDGY